MKKILGIVLAFVMLVTVLAIIPAAQEAAQEDGYYVYLDEGITLVHVSGGEEYRIPVAAKDIAKFPKLEDGETTSEYSVHTYLDAHLEKGQPKFLEDLMIALLNYGAAAQQYFGVTGELVGTPVTDTADLKAATADEVKVTDDEGIYIGASLLLTGTIQLRFYFKGNDVTTNYGEATNPKDKGYSYIDVPVMPYDMSKAVTVTIDGTTTSVTYAPINYLKNQADNDALSTMVASIYAYGVAAKAYADHEHEFTYGDPIIIEATCTESGSRTTKCVCGETKTEVTEALGHNYNSGVITKTATCAPGNKKFTCTRTGCGDIKNEAIPPITEHTIDEDELIVSVTPTATKDGAKTAYCGACEDWAEYTYTLAEYNSDLSNAKANLSGYKVNSGSVTSVSSMSTNAYSAPKATPTSGEHPRVLINSATLTTVKNALSSENDKNRDEMISLIRSVCDTANNYTSGKLDSGNSHNVDSGVLDSAMAKAFLYLFYDVDTYAYDAVRIIKEYLSTMKVSSSGDPERIYGEAIFAAAVVYDWCHGAMTDADKADLIKCVQNIGKNMEIGFPPSKQGAVNGHGCERQLLRDYLSFAIAIYDENPSWYAYIGGRFYQEYLPVREEFYKSGMYPQGISTYVQIRFSSDLWSAWLLTTATGSNPYEGMGQDQVIRSLFSRVVDGAYYVFDEGDDERDVDNWGREIIRGLSLSATISSYLYDDSTAAAWSNYVDYYYTSSLYLLILRSTGIKDDSDSRYDGLELICYNGGFLNEIVAHTDWSGNAASVLMKIGGYTAGNHDHGDAGSFQIYYKGMLAGDTGYYDDYSTTSSSHFQKYHQATVAHNSILVYGTSYNRTTSYGQKVGSDYGEPTTRSAWLNGTTYKTADLLGVCTEYDRNGNPKYAYIAGDITPAYTNSSITGVERRMLSVFNTQNSDAPMYFFVYDRVKTSNSTYQAAFLLHTVNEPTIDGNTVTVTSGGNVYNEKPKTGGQLVLQSIIGGSTIRTYGGENMNYVVNGSQVATKSGQDDGYWGRVEILTDKGTDHTMLNVMYVTDAGKTLSLPATGFSTDKVDGAAIGNSVAVFLKNTTNYNGTLTFTAPDTGYGEKVFYYVSGMAEGRWTVTCGSQVINVSVGKGDGLLVFNTYAGKEVTITPATDSSGSFDNELPIEPIN